ncbi:MAG: phosphoribosyl-AMP cyclohydrolase [Gammaproteobacteria bacterium]|nr:phosphoribosyl-AMP cyclohydrolase [Gammaproteobacteria bacterium]
MTQKSDQHLSNDWIKEIKWDESGLVPAIAQEKDSGEVLMMAWMNAEALELTNSLGHAVYWSRSRQKLWHKGESSGHQQAVHAIQLDCDNDVIILKVEQIGGIACHTGRKSCFYRTLENNQWVNNAPVLKNPQSIYK